MYYRLSEYIKKRILRELRHFWSYDLVYRDRLVPNIQGKYSFKQRPCESIILKSSSANSFKLSADNFQGTVHSYCHLTKVENYPGLAIEWVREDIRAIIENGGTFPTEPGIYYIEVSEESVNFEGVVSNRKVFYVDALLEVYDEQPTKITDFTYQLANYPLHDGSLRVFELPGQIEYVEDTNFTVDTDTGVITLTNVLPNGTFLSCDYRYPDDTAGPYVIQDNHTNVKAIPGVVLAFGRRSEAGDIMAVIVGERREPVALEYGGRWDLGLDLDVTALDVHAQAEITDRTLMFLQGVAYNRLSTEGIEILEVSFGGEGEEIYDETADDYMYTASLSMTIQTDWAIHVPLDPMIRRVSPMTKDDYETMMGMTEDELLDEGVPNRLQMVQNLKLIDIADPFFVGRNKTYEVIK